MCPKGCHLQVDETQNYSVLGHSCSRGEKYAKEELINPTRVITSTVCVEGGIHRRCPVKTNGPLPKGKIMESMALLNDVILKVPVTQGQVVVRNVCDTGVDFITTRSLTIL